MNLALTGTPEDRFSRDEAHFNYCDSVSGLRSMTLDPLVTVNSEIFVRSLFSRTALKDIFGTFKILRLGHDLPTSVIDSDFAISGGFIFAKLRIREV